MDRENIGDIRRNENRGENSFLYVIKNFIIYIIMGAAIIITIFCSEFFRDEVHHIKGMKKKLILPVILIIVVIIIIFVATSVKGSKNFIQTEEKKQIDQSRKTFVKRLTKEEYERSKAETTQKELQKLYENRQFKKLLNERGSDTKKWAWQSREKDKKVVYKDNEDSEDIDRLSQISLSD